ncbi:helix-turn-helix domain-containing protein [Paraburkholderia bannensis]|uniref:helix-turn-helix domain-containing protein n=1 Tax=Paraburkholderia bannensis TaxID=765414 RepID=UPI002AB656B5|nr:helix-turn-helix domain-containing protein [Paraburkholderia bannensis]
MSANHKRDGSRWSGRREHAARMLAAGKSIAYVAATLDLSAATARRYASAFTEGGAQALAQMGDVGRRPRLTAEDLERVTRSIRQRPDGVGLAGEYWTNTMVQRFIAREFQVCYSYSHINRLIRDHGLQHWIRQGAG